MHLAVAAWTDPAQHQVQSVINRPTPVTLG
jgi:hypothetical protein